MITLRKYKATGPEILILLIFFGISLMGIVYGYVAYSIQEYLAATLLIGSGVLLFIISVLPVTGLLWTDDNNNLYFFPDRTKYLFKTGDDA